MICEKCGKKIKVGDKYIHQIEYEENFCSKECAQKDNEQYLEELTLEPDKEE